MNDLNGVWLVAIKVGPRCHRIFHNGKINGHVLHRELMRLAPDALGDHPRHECGLLFRAEYYPSGLRVLAQLRTAPRVNSLKTDFADHVEQRRINPLLDKLYAGARVRYRIDANATKRHGKQAQEHKRGKLANLRGNEADLWWLRKAETAGLGSAEVRSSPQPDVLGRPIKTASTVFEGASQGDVGTIHGVTRFEGTAVVTDPGSLRESVLTGIGRARTYGCGLLSLGFDW